MLSNGWFWLILDAVLIGSLIRLVRDPFPMAVGRDTGLPTAGQTKEVGHAQD
jgi:hypothetical protein